MMLPASAGKLRAALPADSHSAGLLTSAYVRSLHAQIRYEPGRSFPKAKAPF